MTYHPTPARTTGNSQKGERAAPGLDQSLFWKDVRHGLLFVAAFVAIGGGAVFFLTLPRHEQAMLIYGAVVVGCASLIVAGLRRKRGR